ncbi:MAG: hypothetical protein ACFFD2_18425 [Promethearchaeota archaeon]
MKNTEKLKIFKDAVKKAKEGELYGFDEWLRDNKVNPKAFNSKYIFHYMRAYPNCMIGNEEIIEKIGEIIGHFLKDMRKTYHIAIIGAKGTGKTLLLTTIENFTNSIESNLGSRINVVDDEDFLRRVVKTEPDIVSTSSARRGAIKFIDNCEKVDEIDIILKNIVKLRDNGVYITTWTPESWLEFNEKNKDLLPITAKFILTPIENDDIFANFLNSICDAIMLVERVDNIIIEGRKNRCLGFIKYNKMFDYYDFEKNKFHEYSDGIPQLVIDLFFASIEQVFVAEKEKMDADIIDSVAKRMDLDGIKKKMENISTQHLQILSKLLCEKRKEGTRPKELVDEFNLDKSTIAYHLKELKNTKKLIELERIGKSSFYKVKKNVIPFIQLKILEEWF